MGVEKKHAALVGVLCIGISCHVSPGGMDGRGWMNEGIGHASDLSPITVLPRVTW